MLSIVFSEFLVLSLAALALCRPVPAATSPEIGRSSIVNLPDGWEYYGPANPTDPIHLRVALSYFPESTTDEDDSTNPQTPSDYADPYSYGRYLNTEESEAYTPSLQPTLTAVREWLVTQGIVKVTVDRDWLNLDTTVDKADALLSAAFAYYRYHGQEPVLRSLSYTVPADMTDDIDYIYPVNDFESGP